MIRPKTWRYLLLFCLLFWLCVFGAVKALAAEMGADGGNLDNVNGEYARGYLCTSEQGIKIDIQRSHNGAYLTLNGVNFFYDSTPAKGVDLYHGDSGAMLELAFAASKQPVVVVGVKEKNFSYICSKY